MIFKYEIPIRLYSIANLRQHWGRKTATNKSLKLALSAFICPDLHKIKIPAKIILKRIAPRKLDNSDNLPMAFKSTKDIIANLFFPETKLGVADDWDCFEWEYSQEKGKPNEYGIEIIIEEI